MKYAIPIDKMLVVCYNGDIGRRFWPVAGAFCGKYNENRQELQRKLSANSLLLHILEEAEIDEGTDGRTENNGE